VTAWYLLAAVGLLIANGFFVAAEFAITAARRASLEERASEGDGRARTALKSITELSFMLAGAQLGITIASLLLGFIAEPAVATVIEAGIESIVELPPSVVHAVSFVVALGIVVFLHMVVGEMAPKNMAIADPEKTALWLALPFRAFVNVFRPFIRLLNAIANGALKLFGVEAVDELEEGRSAQDIATMITQSARDGMLGKVEHRLLSGAIEFRDRDAADVMVPRTEVVAVSADATPEDIERAVVETGHSRFPVYAGDIDHVLGFFHAKDLLLVAREARARVLERRLIRPMLVVPESRKLHPLLFDMRRQRRHFALVVDEHGGTGGVVTIEDLLEELVGEIRDEYDISELGVEELGGNSYLIPGTLRIDEAADRLGVRLPEGDYETVAGFLMSELGRIPRRRDVVQHANWRLRVRQMHRRRVVQILVEPLRATARADESVPS